MFSLETASDYLKDEKASFFGFKCTVIGYEWNSKAEDVRTMFYDLLSVMYKPCCRVLEREMVWYKQGRSYSIL